MRFISRSYSACAAFCSVARCFSIAACCFANSASALALAAASSAACAAAAAAFIFAVRSSCADSRSMAVPYFACSGEAATAASIAVSGVGDISACGARRRVQATGLGAPFSFMTVTIASPVPRLVSTSSRA